MKLLIGIALGLAIGVLCKLFGVPVPAPPVLEGALLVVAMTLGYRLMDNWKCSTASSEHQCGGPSGQSGDNT